MNRTLDYANLVLSGKKIAGNTEILCCQRFIDDLERSKSADYEYYFDIEQAEYYIDLANSLMITIGDKLVNLQTRGFQNFILGNLMGWKSKITGYRRFRESYIQMGRRQGKSFLSGILCVDFCNFIPQYNSRIFVAAINLEQANIVWEETAKFILADSDLLQFFKVSRPDGTIYGKNTGNKIIACTRNIKSKEGQENVLTICDELHLHPSNETYNILFLGQANVNNALTSAISTAGFDLNSFGYEHYKFCKKVVQGIVKKESQFVFITEPDEGDDYFTADTWLKANPLQLFKNDTEVNEEMVKRYADMANTAKEKGGSELINFITKICNVWCELQENSLVPMEKFQKCSSKRTLEDMRDRECFVGLDLSNSNDLTALSLIFPPINDNENVYIYSHAYIPSNRLLDHEKSDKAPYRVWKKMGLITPTTTLGGLKTDHKYIIDDLKYLINTYDFKLLGIGYDPYGMGAMLQMLEDFGTDVIAITQSALSLSESIQDFKVTVESLQIEYNENNSLLQWSAANAKLEENSYGEVKLVKEKPGKRIDIIASIIDAWKLYYLQKSSYNTEESVDEFINMIKNRN